jgi:PqqD family protein of HPr-rel-A system
MTDPCAVPAVTGGQRAAVSAGRVTRCPAVLAEPLDDDLLLYDPRSGQAYVLNATGAYLWSLCDGSRTLCSLARALAASYALAYPDALADVRDHLDELQAAGLLLAE